MREGTDEDRRNEMLGFQAIIGHEQIKKNLMNAIAAAKIAGISRKELEELFLTLLGME